MTARESVTAYISLGANLGDPVTAVKRALSDLHHLPLTRVTAASDLYQSAPHETQGPDFINAVAALTTALSAADLLLHLQGLEQAAGRERPWPHAPRTLDLDLLFYGDACINSPALTLPHPRWAQRAFVLTPLAQIAPHRVSPAQQAAVAHQRLVRLPATPSIHAVC